MNITRYQSRDLFRDLSEQMNRFLSDRFDKEEDDKFLVRADLPGVEPNDIDVGLKDGVLSISGRRESEIKDEKDGYSRVECTYGEFNRQFTLPETADADKVAAKCDKGVLEITIGKSEARKPKRIAVKAS